MHKILVVEDNGLIRNSLSTLLTFEGFTVVTASDGEEALARAKADGPPCLIFLDLYMPRMDGAEFLRKAQEDAALSKVPTIILTAANQPPVVEYSQVIGFLTKPIDIEVLVEYAKQYC